MIKCVEDLALQRNKYKHLSDEEWRWFLQQEEGRLRTADKLPAFAAIPEWWYPVRLSCEQCSSELTARYKAQIVLGSSLPDGTIIPSLGTCLDLTGGYGVDTFFLSEHFAHTDYVEQNAELCRIAAHNFALAHKPITVHNTTAEEFLNEHSPNHQSPITNHQYTLIFLDPARRDSHGGKVFRLQDCTPNVIELLPALLQHLTPDGRIMLKLSPMLDITQALKELSSVHHTSFHRTITWDVHVVAVKNEVKEVLLLSRRPKDQANNQMVNDQMVNDQMIKCLDLSSPEQAFSFTREEEQKATVSFVHCTLSPCTFLYEPSAAILKAGAYKLIAARFGLQKLDVNTHLYVSDRWIEEFPGRIWRIEGIIGRDAGKAIATANILVRNYPLTPDQLKKKLHLRDGGTAFVIACRVVGKPTLFLASRVHSIDSFPMSEDLVLP